MQKMVGILFDNADSYTVINIVNKKRNMSHPDTHTKDHSNSKWGITGCRILKTCPMVNILRKIHRSHLE